MSATRHLPVVSAWVNERAREERERERIVVGYYRQPRPDPDETPEDDPSEEESLDVDDDASEPEPESQGRPDRHTHRQVRHAGGSPRPLTPDELDELDASLAPTDHPRPRTRGECADGVRPCPYAACTYHLYLDVDENGAIRANFPSVGPDEMVGDSCALDVADRGAHSLDDVGDVMNLTYERVRQIEELAVRKMKRSHDLKVAFEERE